MTISAIAVFFAQQVGSKAVQLIMERITGETQRRAELEMRVKNLDAGQMQVLDILHQQLEAHFTAATKYLDYAQHCPVDLDNYRSYLKLAVQELTRCTSLRHFEGLRKARIYVYLGMCQHLLRDRINALRSLKKARRIADNVARVRGEICVRQESIDVDLGGGHTAHGTHWIRVEKPELQHSALSLIREIDDALKYARAH